MLTAPPTIADIPHCYRVAGLVGIRNQAKPLKGFGGVLEVVEDFKRDTYRAVYTVRFKNAVYVLHCFQKKSTQGIKTPRPNLDMIKERLKAAEGENND